jgi:DNA-binding CsgD family transcriptional regulator
MKRLSHTGRQIRELVEMIDASAERTEVFAEVCENLEQAIGFSGAVLIPHGPSADAISHTGHLVLNESTKHSLAFVQHYASLDPFFTHWMRTPTNFNKAARNTDVVSVGQLKDSEFFQDFLRTVPALYVLGGLLAHKGRVLAGFALHRTSADRDFSERDTLIMNCVLPPLARTLSLLEAPSVTAVAERPHPEAALQALHLSHREEQILHYVLDGRRYREIAGDLHVHIQTVKKHMRDILAKAHARNRHELIVQLCGLQ